MNTTTAAIVVAGAISASILAGPYLHSGTGNKGPTRIYTMLGTGQTTAYRLNMVTGEVLFCVGIAPNSNSERNVGDCWRIQEGDAAN